MCEKTLQAGEKPPERSRKKTILKAHIGPGIVPVVPARLENQIICGASGKENTQRDLPQWCG